MNANLELLALGNDDFAAELADAALAVAAEHAVTADSVDVELDLWHALGDALRGQRRSCSVLGQATDAAYRALLRRHPVGPFLDLELGLWNAFRQRWPRQGVVIGAAR